MSHLLPPDSPAYRMSGPQAITHTASSIVLDPGTYLVVVTVTGKTMTLPSAVGRLCSRHIIKNGAVKNTTVVPQTGETIDGQTSYIVGSEYGYVEVISDGQGWLTCGKGT